MFDDFREIRRIVDGFGRQSSYDVPPGRLRVGSFHLRRDPIREHGQTDTVSLLKRQVAQRRTNRRRVVELGPGTDPGGRIGSAPPLFHLEGSETHRRRRVDENDHIKIGLLLVLLQVELVTATEHLPLQVFQVITGDILAMLREFDRESLIWGPVHSAHDTFSDHPRPEFKRRQLPDRFWGEVLFGTHTGGFGSRIGQLVLRVEVGVDRDLRHV